MRARDDREVAARARNERERIAREAVESEVRSVFLAGYTLSANHRPYDGEDDRGEPAAWDEYRKLFDPVSRLSVVWCRCGDGIEDPKCKTCYMTDTDDGPGEVVAWNEVRAASPPPHAAHLVQRLGIVFQATPCYGMHAPWWVQRLATGGEGDPFPMLEDDLWTPLDGALYRHPQSEPKDD